jgi:SAM-dependent methyltransferase
MKKPFNWERSLESEKEYWLRTKEWVCSQEWADHMQNRTQWFVNWYSQTGEITNATRIVHVGCGPDGEINFIKKGLRFAVDPLADFYREHFSEVLDPDVDFHAGRGEKIPFDSEFFDLAISYNSLDHVEDPSAVLSEIRRVLKLGAILYLGIHVRSEYARFLHELSKHRREIEDHYFHYSRRTLRQLVESQAFTVLDERGETEAERLSISRPAWMRSRVRRSLHALRGHSKRTWHVLAKKT